jgi:hypothetical protein
MNWADCHLRSTLPPFLCVCCLHPTPHRYQKIQFNQPNLPRYWHVTIQAAGPCPTADSAHPPAPGNQANGSFQKGTKFNFGPDLIRVSVKNAQRETSGP